jgi:DNA-binding NarL/FixJ family response regulator
MKDKFKHGYSVKGMKHPSVKLSDTQVREIRSLLSQGYLHKDIAEIFNVGKTTITAINVGQNWAHLL